MASPTTTAAPPTNFTDRNGILGAAIDLNELKWIEPVHRHAQAIAQQPPTDRGSWIRRHIPATRSMRSTLKLLLKKSKRPYEFIGEGNRYCIDRGLNLFRLFGLPMPCFALAVQLLLG